MKRPLIAVMISGGLAGLYAGLSGLVRYSFGSPGIPTIAVFIGEDPFNIVKALITMAIAFCASFVLTWFLGFEDEKDEDSDPGKNGGTASIAAGSQEDVFAPIQGEVEPLSAVKDEAFASGSLGEGAAIVPSEGKVYAPFDGKVEMLFSTKHALGLTSEHGVELMIHVGIDTVNLNGQYFDAHVKTGDTIRKGDLLLSFDREAIRKAGYDITVPIVVTNASDHKVKVQNTGSANHNTVMLKVE